MDVDDGSLKALPVTVDCGVPAAQVSDAVRHAEDNRKNCLARLPLGEDLVFSPHDAESSAEVLETGVDGKVAEAGDVFRDLGRSLELRHLSFDFSCVYLRSE